MYHRYLSVCNSLCNERRLIKSVKRLDQNCVRGNTIQIIGKDPVGWTIFSNDLEVAANSTHLALEVYFGWIININWRTHEYIVY